MSLIDNLKWRYATKKFDAGKKISAEHLGKIKEAIQLAASSYGLQLYKVLIIEDPEIREKLKAASWGQTQVTDASHLIVFCSNTTVSNGDIDAYLKLKADTQGLDINGLQGYGDFMKNALGALSPEQQRQWTAKQTYIALGNLLAACAELRIDSCPMEGFDPAQYDEILGLNEKGFTTAVIATVGYRSDEDQTQHLTKVRKPAETLFEAL